ncbi:hypothetical protein M9458_013560, partial [Cirrhinus mrigala]
QVTAVVPRSSHISAGRPQLGHDFGPVRQSACHQRLRSPPSIAPLTTRSQVQPIMSCINTRPFPLFWAEYWTAFSTVFV